MKKSILLLFILTILFFANCVSENSQNNEISTPEVINAKTEEIAGNLLESTTEKNDENIDESTTTESVSVKDEKVRDEIKNILREQIKGSELKDTECEEILKKYEEVANKYIQTLDGKVFMDISKWVNDPIFKSCIKQEPYKSKYDALQIKMDEAEEG